MASNRPATAPTDLREADPRSAELREDDAHKVQIQTLLAPIADKLEATEAEFERLLGSDVPFVRDAGAYLFASGGKRVRPAMLLLCARALGHDSDEEVHYAAVVELIHTATLIHDDIIDHADIRRGRETLNRVWGNSLTVLLGDWLYATAMESALRHDNIEVIRSLCTATRRMTEGEMMGLARLGAIDLTFEEYMEILDRKTAQLFAAACSIPTLIEPADAKSHEALFRYGHSLGVCFQLVDDMLDFTADRSELGKPVLSDLKEGRLTLPLILALPRIPAERRAQVEAVLHDRAFDRVSAQEILEIVQREGTIDEVSELAERYSAMAREQLAVLPSCDAKNVLEFAPDFVLHRRS